MSGFVLAILTASLALGLMAHIAVWRWRRPADDAGTLMRMLVLLPLVISATTVWLFLPRESLAGVLILAAMFHVGTGFTYMSLYTAAQAASPSSLLLLRLAQAGKAGLTEDQVRALFTMQELAGDSLQSAIDERFLVMSPVPGSHQLSVAARGRALILVCSALRGVLRLPLGRG